MIWIFILTRGLLYDWVFMPIFEHFINGSLDSADIYLQWPSLCFVTNNLKNKGLSYYGIRLKVMLCSNKRHKISQGKPCENFKRSYMFSQRLQTDVYYILLFRVGLAGAHDNADGFSSVLMILVTRDLILFSGQCHTIQRCQVLIVIHELHITHGFNRTNNFTNTFISSPSKCVSISQALCASGKPGWFCTSILSFFTACESDCIHLCILLFRNEEYIISRLLLGGLTIHATT